MKAMTCSGLDELKVYLGQCKSMDLVKQVVSRNTMQMNESAADHAPVRTGNLRRSITMNLEDDGLTGIVKAQAEYAPYVEWGTRFMEAEPYMKPAFEKQKPIFLQQIKDCMK